MIFPAAADEEARLEALRSYALLDTPPERELDELTRLAARLCDAPMALLSLVDRDRQWFKARFGVSAQEAPRAIMFCDETIAGRELLVIPDARQNPRFADTPFVARDPFVRFYAGVPLLTPDGAAIGTLCVLDQQPRGLTAEQAQALEALARQCMLVFNLRRQLAQLADAEVLAARGRAVRDQLACAVIEQSDEGIVVADAAGILRLYNAAAARQLGVQRADVAASDWAATFALLDLDGRPLSVDASPLVRAARGETILGARWLVRAPGGELRLLEGRATPLRGPDGSPTGAMLVTRDETDRERAREALRQSEERLRTVLASAPLVLFALDAEGRFEVAAGRGLEILGVRAVELLGAPVLELCKDVPWIVDAIRRALAGEEVRATGAFWGRTFETQYTPVRDDRGKVKGLTGLAIDMTERAQALERLRESESRLRRVIESNMIGIVFWDASGPIWDANRAFLEAVGYSREELEAGCISWMDLTPPEHRHKDEQALAEIATFGTCAPFEKEYVRKDGTRVPVLLGAAGLDGRSDRGVAFVVDIADRKSIEEELRKAIRVRDEFLTIASHELRTPLTTLELQLEMIERLLRKRPEEPPDDRFGRKVALALRQVERLKGLIDGLLDVSRIAMGRLQLDLSEIDLGEIAREVTERFEDEAERQRCSLRVEGAAVRGLWDKVRIEQVVTNLVTNAIKYSPGTAIEVFVSGDERCATLCVRDRGIGIRSQDLARIFERFERAVSSRNYGGLGLGLYITRQVVEAHGGSIEVSSQPGEGATFTVRLPRAPATPAASSPRRAEEGGGAERGAAIAAERS